MGGGGGGGWGRGEPEELGVRTKTILYVSTLEIFTCIYTCTFWWKAMTNVILQVKPSLYSLLL